MKKRMANPMNDIIICSASMDNLEDLVRLSKMCFSIPWTKESLKQELLDTTFRKYLVAIKDNIVIGFIGVWIVLDEGHITNIAVHPEYRGIGIGDKLLNNLIYLCRNLEIKNITLEVRKSNIIAQNLYKKYGFLEQGIRKKYYANNNEDAIIMWKYNI
jgi:ribosomal-protein-alanine N-acetyltransferase